MRTIHKYTLALVDGAQSIEIPRDAEFLSAQMQRGKICVWAIVDTDKLNDMEYFIVLGTGHPVPEKPKYLQFLGTVQEANGSLVWHIFRAIK